MSSTIPCRSYVEFAMSWTLHASTARSRDRTARTVAARRVGQQRRESQRAGRSCAVARPIPAALPWSCTGACPSRDRETRALRPRSPARFADGSDMPQDYPNGSSGSGCTSDEQTIDQHNAPG